MVVLGQPKISVLDVNNGMFAAVELWLLGFLHQ